MAGGSPDASALGWVPCYRRAPAAVGESVADVDTPAMLLDLDKTEANVAKAITMVNDGVHIRPHVKSHKTPGLALLQVARSGGRTRGICAQKVVEAEAMVAGGITDVAIVNEVIGMGKVRRIAALAAAPFNATVSVVVDSSVGLDQLATAAKERGVSLSVLVELDVGQRRAGVATIEEAVALGREAAAKAADGLTLVGIQCYQGAAQHIRTPEERSRVIDGVVSRAAACKAAFEAAGLPCGVVTGAGSGTLELEGRSGVFTEVQPGSYVLMDADYARNVVRCGEAGESEDWGRRWGLAMTLLATVMSRNAAAGYLVLDCGLKASSVDSGPPVLLSQAEGWAGASVTPAGSTLPTAAAPVADAAAGPAPPMSLEHALAVVAALKPGDGLKFGVLTDEHATVLVDTASPAFGTATEARAVLQAAGRVEEAGAAGEGDVAWFAQRALPPLGAKMQLVVGHCDPSMNLHPFLVAHRGGKVEAVWQVAGQSPGY